MSEEVLIFAEITEQEKRLLNLYRNFFTADGLESEIEELKEGIVSNMVRQSVEEWALEEVMEAKGKDLCEPPYKLFAEFVARFFDHEESQDTLKQVRKQWEERIQKFMDMELTEITED